MRNWRAVRSVESDVAEDKILHKRKFRNELTEHQNNKDRLETKTIKNNRSLSSYPRACEFCGKICTYRQVFFAHRKKCNSFTGYLDLNYKRITEYVCCHCNKLFNRKFNLQKHLESEVCVKRRTDCCKDTKSNSENTLSESQLIENEENKEYTCAHCGKIFKKKCNLQRHVKRAVCSNKCGVKRCKLKCWESDCSALFYKQIDLVHHLKEQHGKTLAVEKIEFSDYNAFQTWKNEENSIKFMNARKLTGSKRSSKGLSYYFVCQFYRKNETESTKRKTNRRKTVGIIPNTKCPSRILVKECGSKIHVTYISTHNHDLYDPLQKKPLSVNMKSLVNKRHISGMKFKDECVEVKGENSWEVFCGNKDKQRTYIVHRLKDVCHVSNCVVKCYEEHCSNLCEHLYKCSCSKKNIFCKHMHKVHSVLNRGMLNVNSIPHVLSHSVSPRSFESCVDNFHLNEETEDERLVRSAQNCLVKLNTYAGDGTLHRVFLKQFVQTLQSLCEQCEDAIVNRNPIEKQNNNAFTPSEIACNQIQKSLTERSTIPQPNNEIICRCFTAPITETANLLKPLFKPNINILSLKSLDTYISEREIHILKSVDPTFSVGWLYDAVVDSFLNIICSKETNIYVANTMVTHLLLNDQPLPSKWNSITWSTIDLIFVPCRPVKNHWLLLIIPLKESMLYILDPSTSLDSVSSLFKKYPNLLNCWCNVLKYFFNIFQCNIISLPHTKQNSPYNSSVLICWYAFQYLNKYSLTENVNTDIFRKFIHDTIVNGPQVV